jgi:hypothetical protein
VVVVPGAFEYGLYRGDVFVRGGQIAARQGNVTGKPPQVGPVYP